MSRPHRSFENFALLQAASEGSASAVQDALEAGADINTSDTSGRTVLTCALTADRYVPIFSAATGLPPHRSRRSLQMGDRRRVRRVVHVSGPPQRHPHRRLPP